MPSPQPSSSGRQHRRARPLFKDRDALSWLFLSRLLLVLALLLITSFTDSASWLPQVAHPGAARLLLLAQTLLILASGLMAVLGRPGRDQQLQLAIYVDLACAVLLIHFSGGVGTGFGLLPVVALTWGALLREGRQSLLFAALAAIGVISVQVYSQLYLTAYHGSYLEAGLLGLVYFSVAALAHGLAQQLRASRQLAAQRQLDILDLSTLNDFVIQQLHIGVLVIDGERRIRLLNTAAQRLLQGSHWRRGTALARAAPALLAWLERAIAGESVGDAVIELGAHRLRPSLHLLGHQRPHGALIYLRDEQEMRREAQAMNLASLGRLSASVAHNIRNPLAAISHASQLLDESQGLDADDRQLLAIIRRNTQRLDETVASVLELSNRHRAEPQAIALEPWLDEFCREYRETYDLTSSELGLELRAHAVEVRTDPRHLRQILSNLCDNARRHGRDGTGRCAMRLILARDAARRSACVQLCDGGSGVPAEHHDAIFEPFFTTAASGSGLGLYAARALAEANGARLEYRPGARAGACFTLTFAA